MDVWKACWYLRHAGNGVREGPNGWVLVLVDGLSSFLLRVMPVVTRGTRSASERLWLGKIPSIEVLTRLPCPAHQHREAVPPVLHREYTRALHQIGRIYTICSLGVGTQRRVRRTR